MNARDRPYVGRGECPPGRHELLERTGFLDRARARGELGMASAAAHAESDAPGWGQRAASYLMLFAVARGDCPWTIEVARTWAYENGLDQPPDGRAWGGVTKSFLAGGAIERVGYAPAVSSNMSPKAIYRVRRIAK